MRDSNRDNNMLMRQTSNLNYTLRSVFVLCLFHTSILMKTSIWSGSKRTR